jgi:hypothetical protein
VRASFGPVTLVVNEAGDETVRLIARSLRMLVPLVAPRSGCAGGTRRRVSAYRRVGAQRGLAGGSAVRTGGAGLVGVGRVRACGRVGALRTRLL